MKIFFPKNWLKIDRRLIDREILCTVKYGIVSLSVTVQSRRLGTLLFWRFSCSLNKARRAVGAHTFRSKEAVCTKAVERERLEYKVSLHTEETRESGASVGACGFKSSRRESEKSLHM